MIFGRFSGSDFGIFTIEIPLYWVALEEGLEGSKKCIFSILRAKSDFWWNFGPRQTLQLGCDKYLPFLGPYVKHKTSSEWFKVTLVSMKWTDIKWGGWLKTCHIITRPPCAAAEARIVTGGSRLLVFGCGGRARRTQVSVHSEVPIRWVVSAWDFPRELQSTGGRKHEHWYHEDDWAEMRRCRIYSKSKFWSHESPSSCVQRRLCSLQSLFSTYLDRL